MADSWAVVRVHDNGPGIAPAVLSRLFQQWTPGSAAGGLGIGLYVARGIVQAHGGSLAVDSAPETGTTFTVRLPSIASAAQQGAPPAPSAQLPRAGGGR